MSQTFVKYELSNDDGLNTVLYVSRNQLLSQTFIIYINSEPPS